MCVCECVCLLFVFSHTVLSVVMHFVGQPVDLFAAHVDRALVRFLACVYRTVSSLYGQSTFLCVRDN